jgi:hypothetical protein
VAGAGDPAQTKWRRGFAGQVVLAEPGAAADRAGGRRLPG